MIATEKNLKKVLEDIELQKKIVPGAWVVKHNGKILTLASGKGLWKQIGHAKAALINHFEHIYPYSQINEFGFKDAKALSHYLLEEKILVVEQL